MNTGIQDAANVAWKIAPVQRGAASDALVSTYDSERHPVGKQMVRNTAALLKLAMVGGPGKVIRDRVLPVALSLPALQHAFASFLMEESINYRNGPLADGSSRDSIRSGDGWPLSAGAQAELVLVGTFDRTTTPATFGGPNGFPLTVTTPTPEDPRAARLAHRNTAALVRPDGVVASVGEDIGAVMSWQSRLSLDGTVPRPLAA